MPSTYSYPGVYIQELPSPVHAIAGVATSVAAFVGYTASGMDNRAQAIYSFSDYQRLFGGLASNSELSYAVQQFYQNGGAQAYVVRTPMHYTDLTKAYAQVVFGPSATCQLAFRSLSSGQWANGQLLIDVDVQGLDLSVATGDPYAFNLTTTNLTNKSTEYFPAVSLNSSQQNYVAAVINDADNGSQLVNVDVAATVIPAPASLNSAAVLLATGLVGKALPTTAVTAAGVTTNYLEGVNSALAGGITNTTASADCSLALTLPVRTATTITAGTTLTIKVIGSGAPIPQTVQGLASQLQQAINTALAISVPGALVVCSATPAGATSSSIRINALLPNQPDALITFGTPASGNDAATALGLIALVSNNASHYALGTGIGGALPVQGTEISSTAAAAPVSLPHSQELIGDQQSFTGLYALLKVPSFNLLSIPEAARSLPGNPSAADPNINPVQIYSSAIALCDQARALLLIDPPPNVTTVSGAVDWKSSTIGVFDKNGAAYWPRLRLADPLNNGNLRTFAPSGVVAGVYAKSDGASGVWTAPAGIGANLNGVQNMTYLLSDAENGVLNPLGLNCFRTFPIYGPVLWGARTLVGADAAASQWKYVPVRRTALFLESSLFQGTQWVVFQPNDELLWAAVRLNVSSFLQTLFLKGAFQGQTPDQAYFVKCDSETTTQTDIDNGVVNILVGFAPLVPAEFVVIQIEQLTGQAGS